VDRVVLEARSYLACAAYLWELVRPRHLHLVRSSAIRRVFGDGIDRLQAVTRKAVRTLQECLGAAKASDRIKAADRLLAHGLRAAELKDLAERVEALEQLLAERGPAPGPRANGAAVPHPNGRPAHGRA
jgi:hypothetical protein